MKRLFFLFLLTIFLLSLQTKIFAKSIPTNDSNEIFQYVSSTPFLTSAITTLDFYVTKEELLKYRDNIILITFCKLKNLTEIDSEKFFYEIRFLLLGANTTEEPCFYVNLTSEKPIKIILMKRSPENSINPDNPVKEFMLTDKVISKFENHYLSLTEITQICYRIEKDSEYIRSIAFSYAEVLGIEVPLHNGRKTIFFLELKNWREVVNIGFDNPKFEKFN